MAELLDVSVISVNGVLQRAKKTLGARGVRPGAARPSRAPLDHDLLARYVAAFERFDVEALVLLLPDDAAFSMPPYELGCKALPRCVTGWPLTRAGVRTSSPSRPTAPPVTRCTGSRPDCAKNDRQHGD